MPRFFVEKDLLLSVEVEAETPREAYDKMLDMNDNTFMVMACEYTVFDADGEPVDPAEWEDSFG